MATKIINRFGTMIGWNEITVPLLGRELEGINELEYDDNQDWEAEYGSGNKPIGEKKGNYSAKAAMALSQEEWIALQTSLPKGGRVQDIPRFDVPVVYEYDGNIYKDIIRNCRIKNRGVSVKQGDGSIWQKMELHCSHIEWNV